ncbi:MAG: hypothetical protein HUU55_05930 [Myxococcales bacterium]|nr:hypothetical protein [Myxococcales bacterium]
MKGLSSIVSNYYPFGARFMIVLLEDDKGNPALGSYCNAYAAKYKLPLDKIVVAIDPAKKSLIYYETNVVSLSVFTNRFSEITNKAETNNADALVWSLDFELKKMCTDLGLDPSECIPPKE